VGTRPVAEDGLEEFVYEFKFLSFFPFRFLVGRPYLELT